MEPATPQTKESDSDDTKGDRIWHQLTDQNPDPSNARQVRAAERLQVYENRTALVMVILALGYLVLYSFYVLDLDLTAGDRTQLNIAMDVIWVIPGATPDRRPGCSCAGVPGATRPAGPHCRSVVDQSR
jgi:hypothetical protein